MVNFATSILLFFLLSIGLLRIAGFQNVSCIATERSTLLEFRSSLVGESNRLASWSGEECCEWKGVHCNKLTGHVEGLYLSTNNFSGALPLGLLCNLTSLTTLDLSKNKFHGGISREIGCFTQLSWLFLNQNELNGSISSNLGLLSNLDFLDVSFNSLSGELSESHFAELTRLRVLSLSSNSLTLTINPSWIPPFELQSIALNSVKVGPRFPSWIQTQTRLDILKMSNGSITDNIPNWFEIVHSRIYSLDLSFNNITGRVPNFKNGDPFMYQRYILLSSNKFEGTLGQLPSDIQILDLSNNSLAGRIPVPVDSAVYWKQLRLNDNYFNGSIPDEMCQAASLILLDLSNNKLTGRIPYCLGSLRALVMLNLANNSLYGQIPSSLSSIELLQSLHLDNNKLGGELPPSLQYLKHLRFLDLGRNELEGIIPTWINGQRFTNLTILRLQSNAFFGDIPSHLCQLSKLRVLNLAQNNITGSIPRCFNNFSAMLNYSGSPPLDDYVYLSTIAGYEYIERLLSFMSGRELEFSSNLPYLTSVDLSHNHIIGEIPKELMDLVGLRILKLSSNRLTGKIPGNIGNLMGLLSLDLSMNELSGSIPQSLANLNFLNYLNLSSNKLSGRVPTGNQLQVLLDDPSNYAGNSGLCGKPLPNNCSDEKSPKGYSPSFEQRDAKKSDFSWFYAGIGPGFAVGFLGIFSILLFKKSWRYAFFQFVENLCSKILVWTALKIPKLQRKLQV